MKKLPIENSNQKETVSIELAATKDQGGPPEISRRLMGVGLLAMLAGGLGIVKKAQAFDNLDDAKEAADAASTALGALGVKVTATTDAGLGDLLSFEVVPLANTDYAQIVGTRIGEGAIIPCFKTLAIADATGNVSAVEATHFHPNDDGLIIPCIKTTIEGHALARHELFDADQSGIIPCYKVESQMLEGARIGEVVATHHHDGSISPCYRTTINLGHTLATHELFDSESNPGGIEPCYRVESQMLPGGHIGAVVATHFHDGALQPCFRTAIDLGHTLATHELFNVGVSKLRVESEMLEDGGMGAVKILVGDDTYNLVDGKLVLQRGKKIR